MADNRIAYGFRWWTGLGRSAPPAIELPVADDQSFDVNGGAANVRLKAGDPVIRLASGCVTLCDGAEGAGGALAPWGIVVGVGPYWDGSKMVFSSGLPSDTSYDTNLNRQSKVQVVPLSKDQYWEIDCDDAVTATTKAAYIALMGLNAPMRLHGASGELEAKPRLDISLAADTSSLGWNLVALSETLDNQDFSGNYVKVIVRPNVLQLQSAGVTGI